MVKSYKYRIYPSVKQIELFNKYYECCNYMVDWGIEKLVTEGDKIDDLDLVIELSFLKMKHHMFTNIFNDPVSHRMKQLYKLYKQNSKKDDWANIIRGKLYSKTTLMVYNWFGFVCKRESYIRTVVFGKLKIKGGPEMLGNPNFYIIKKSKSDKYYISIFCNKIEKKVIKKSGKSVGIDMGIHHFLIMSNGIKIDNPKYFEKSKGRIKKLRKELSRKVKGSCNYEKTRVKLANLEEHVDNHKNDFMYKLAIEIVKEYDLICIENADVKSLSRKKDVSKAMRDVSWAKFISILKNKAKEYDKKIIKINRYYPSSQRCSNCGYINKKLKNLNIREWECPICREVHDRDINAARNILQEGIRINTVGAMGIKACGDV